MKILLCLLASCYSLTAWSQKKEQAVIDSLNTVLATTQKAASPERAHTLNHLGNEYISTSDYVHSLQSSLECLALADKFNNDTLRALSYRTMGVIYFYQHDYQKGAACDSQALAYIRRADDLSQMGMMLKGMGDNNLELGDSAKANAFYHAALPILIKQGDKKGEASVYCNQSILFNSNYQARLELALKAKKIFDMESPHNVMPTINTGNIGEAYLDIYRYDTLHKTRPSSIIPADRAQLLELGEKYLKEAIRMSTDNNDVENFAYFTGVLAELQEQKGDFKNAYYNFRQYQSKTDSLYSQENKNKIAALEGQRAIDLKNKEIEKRELLISNQHKKMWLLLICILFLIAVGGLLYRQNRTRKLTNTILVRLNNELDEANKIKAKFFGIISHDLRGPVSNLINFIQLRKRKPGMMSEQEITDRENRIADSASSLLDTMDSMLLWSKGQMEHFKPTIQPVPVNSLFAYLDRFFAGIQPITLTFSDDVHLLIQTDEHYLRTIMHNLTANAVRALEKVPDARIAWKGWQEGDRTFLSITDNGAGVRHEQLKALYDETAISGSKHGLGLHIIRDLAKAIRCTIQLRSEAGSETVFVLSFFKPVPT